MLFGCICKHQQSLHCTLCISLINQSQLALAILPKDVILQIGGRHTDIQTSSSAALRCSIEKVIYQRTFCLVLHLQARLHCLAGLMKQHDPGLANWLSWSCHYHHWAAMQDCDGCLLSPVTAQGISAYTGKHDSRTSLAPANTPHG